MSLNLPTPSSSPPLLPPILAGSFNVATKKRVVDFYFSVASCFEMWVKRRQSAHTQRAYREDVMAFVKFLGIAWPQNSCELLRVSIQDVQAFRDELLAQNAATKTLNRRVSTVSSFFKYLGGAAAELRLPITVRNPAHSQFISRESTDPRDEAKALSATAPAIMGMPRGDSVIDFRDRAILNLYLYWGPRFSTGCRLKISDFH